MAAARPLGPEPTTMALFTFSLRLIVARQLVGPLHDLRPAVRGKGKPWRVHTQPLTPPPVAGAALFICRRKPILPQHGTDKVRGRVGKRIVAEKGKNICIVGQQAYLRQGDEIVLPPLAQRSKPQVPFEARLVRGVDPRGLVQRLRLVSKRIGG